jgi:hypothetical protein
MSLDLITRLDPLKRIRCPFCFERFAACEMHFQCENFHCRSDIARWVDDPIRTRALQGVVRGNGRGTALRAPWWVDPLRDRHRGPRRFFDWMVLPQSIRCGICRHATTYRLCPRCHVHLPDSTLTLDPGHIAIFGPQSVGKTTYITVLIHELDHRVGPKHGFILSPLTEEVRKRYEDDYHGPTYGASQFGLGEELATGIDRRSHTQTAPISAGNRDVLLPLAYRLTRREGGRRASTLISFFDTAGEDWEMHIDQLRAEARYLGQARGLLFLVDPLRIRSVAHDPRLRLTEKESRVPPADYLNDARKLETFFRKMPAKTPLAICLNKLDRWGHLLPEGTALRELTQSIPRRDPDKQLDDSIHEEVRASLDRWGMGGFLEHMEVSFPNHRFFACSSLGDAAQDREDDPQPLPTPILIERPVLWLLERQGMVRRE